MRPMKFGFGQPVKRVEDKRFITGTGRYTPTSCQRRRSTPWCCAARTPMPASASATSPTRAP